MLRKSWRDYLRTCSLCSHSSHSLHYLHSEDIVLDSSLQESENVNDMPIESCLSSISDSNTHGSDSQNEFEIALSELREIGTHLGPVVFCRFDNETTTTTILRTCYVVEKKSMVHQNLFVLLFFIFCRRLVGSSF